MAAMKSRDLGAVMMTAVCANRISIRYLNPQLTYIFISGFVLPFWKYDSVNTILNNIRHTTKTAQKTTKPDNENNRETNWKKTTSLSIQLRSKTKRTVQVTNVMAIEADVRIYRITELLQAAQRV